MQPLALSHTEDVECVQVSRLLVETEDAVPSHVLLFSGRSGRIFRIRGAAWEAIKDQSEDGIPLPKSPLHRVLRDAGILVPRGQDEVHWIATQNERASAGRDTVNLVLFPTSDCNLACVYCGQQHVPVSMQEEDVERVEALAREMLTETERSRLHVAWFGGEPLLAMPAIRALTKRFYAVCHSAGAAYASKMVTNGLLLEPEVAVELMAKLGVSQFEITLDGPAAAHDRRRPRRSGPPETFDRILDNIRHLAGLRERHGCDVRVRCNLDATNVDDARDLIDTLRECNLAGKILLYFVGVYRWGESEGQRHGMNGPTWCERKLELDEYATANGFPQPFLPLMAKRTLCTHVDPASMVVGADLSLFTCTEAPLAGTPAAALPDEPPEMWRCGNLRERPRSRVPAPTWNREVRDGHWPCAECRFFGVCGGACPRQWRAGARPCPPYKFNCDEVLKRAARYRLRIAVDENLEELAWPHPV